MARVSAICWKWFHQFAESTLHHVFSSVHMWELLNFWTLQGHMDKSLTMRKAQVVWDILVMSETKKNWDWDNWDSLRLRLRQRHWDSSRLRLRHPGWRPKKQDNDKIETLRFNVAKTVQSRQMGQKTFVKTWRDRQHRLRQHLLRHSRLRLRHIETIETETNWLRQIIIAKMSHRNSAFLTWRLPSACPDYVRLQSLSNRTTVVLPN